MRVKSKVNLKSESFNRCSRFIYLVTRFSCLNYLMKYSLGNNYRFKINYTEIEINFRMRLMKFNLKIYILVYLYRNDK